MFLSAVHRSTAMPAIALTQYCYVDLGGNRGRRDILYISLKNKKKKLSSKLGASLFQVVLITHGENIFTSTWRPCLDDAPLREGSCLLDSINSLRLQL